MFPNSGSFILVLFLSFLTGFQAREGRDIDTPNVFVNPLRASGADPWVEQKGEWYYFTHTTGKDLRLYRTKKMSEIGSAEMKIVWTPPQNAMNSKQIWAPEIHFIDGKWYFYYAADDGLNENHRMWVLENTADDPFTGTWTDRGELVLPEDKWAIDGTVFELEDKLYFLWSGWEGDVNVSQNIYITRLLNPWTPDSVRVMLSKPELAWETNGKPAVNEGPQFLVKNDKMFIIYSASGCWTDSYTLGMLSADADADPLTPASWRKHAEPMFGNNVSGEAFGAGHNAFFVSPDGSEDWMIYHANPAAGMGCGGKRSPRMQPFTWTSEGYPDFGIPVALGEALRVPSGEE